MAGLVIEPLTSVRGFRLSGELDLFTVDAARAALDPELHGTLVLDLAELEFIDDSGLGLVVRVFKRLKEQDGSLVIRNPRGPVLRVFEITGLAQFPGLTIETEGTL